MRFGVFVAFVGISWRFFWRFLRLLVFFGVFFVVLRRKHNGVKLKVAYLGQRLAVGVFRFRGVELWGRIIYLDYDCFSFGFDPFFRGTGRLGKKPLKTATWILSSPNPNRLPGRVFFPRRAERWSSAEILFSPERNPPV